ncbi:MAG: response regulator [Thermodesulfobacteriota bacterium]|nr:response regulator [Thermodesulfobacteriota bacterium]
MVSINSQEFMDELLFCLKAGDVVKAKALLQFASDTHLDIQTQKQALLEIGRADEKTAFPLLDHLTRIEMADPEIRDVLYDLILDKACGNTDLVIKYITQKEKQNQIIYIKAAGDLLLTEVAPVLTDIINTGTDPDVLYHAVKSLGVLRMSDALPVFSKLIKERKTNDRESRESITAISRLASKEAVDILLSFVNVQNPMALTAIEGIAAIQTQYALETLSSLLSSKYARLRNAAIDQIIQTGKKSVPILTKAAFQDSSDYMVHLITTLGYIGDQAALPCILDIIKTCLKNPNVRQASYEAMERLPSTQWGILLAAGLSDPVEPVRMSAARAVDKNLSKALVAGLKKLIRKENQTAENVVAALIDSRADNIFNFLLQEPAFTRLAVHYVQNKAARAASRHFVQMMKDKGFPELAEKINFQDNEPVENLKKPLDIYVIDDSKMMLKLYQNKLEKFGYAPTLFQFPGEAVKAVSILKPALVITDLNMPEMNGLQLTRVIRKQYSPQQLPVLMITTQSDFIMTKNGEQSVQFNHDTMQKAGISKILHKPFSDTELRKSVDELI